MSIQSRMDPEVRAILEEVALDPRSHLLRVPVPAIPPRREEPVRDTEVLLTRAERRLVEVHRHEVAELLLEEVRRAVLEEQRVGSAILRPVEGDSGFRRHDPREWESRARRRLSVIPEELGESWGGSLLEECVRTAPDRRPSPVQLAAASLRLVPRALTRLYLALALHEAGQTRSGLQVLFDVLDGGPSAALEPYLWQNVGLLESSLDAPRRALNAWRRGALSPEAGPTQPMSWFAEALCQGDRGELRRAERRLRELGESDSPRVERFLEVYVIAARRAAWRPGVELHRVFSSTADELCEAAWRIGDVISRI